MFLTRSSATPLLRVTPHAEPRPNHVVADAGRPRSGVSLIFAHRRSDSTAVQSAFRNPQSAIHATPLPNHCKTLHFRTEGRAGRPDYGPIRNPKSTIRNAAQCTRSFSLALHAAILQHLHETLRHFFR
jgi:hypothetical protein